LSAQSQFAEPLAEEPPAPPRRPWRRRAAAIAIGLALVAILSVIMGAMLTPLPDVRGPLPRPAVVLLTSDGEPFARFGDYKEAPVDAAALPKRVTDAVVAIEDRNFYRHWGVDVRGTGRAILADLKSKSLGQGGSTITQQLAKITTGKNDRTLIRKAQEAVLAVGVDARLSKNEILSRYLSSVYFGDGVYGLRAAARHYFSKEPEKLTLTEAAMLAGVINAPSRLAPTRHLKDAQARADLVLSAMQDTGAITPAQAQAARARPARPKPGRGALDTGGYFADWLAPQIGPLPAAYGEVGIRTTLDQRLQHRAEQILATELARKGKAQRVGQGALVAVRSDGAVVAMVGGRDHDASAFNRAVQARRQPGSAFKIFVYLAALRDGARPESTVLDAPIRVGDWSPSNAGGGYRGPISLEEAFATSSNLAAVQISEHVGREAVIRAARDLGVKSPLQPVPSLALGSNPVTLLELTSAYAAVPAGAYPIIPYGFDQQPAAPPKARLREQAALMQLMGSAVTYGTARRAALWEPAFGKTGTTQDNRDAWFIGFAQDLTVGVWVGNDDNSPMRAVSGGGLPADIWRQFLLAAQPEPIGWAEPEAPQDEDDGDDAPRWLRRLGRLLGF
jgi:penicillin-binding protein 1A